MHTESELLEIANDAATVAWSRFLKLYPRIGSMPKIILNRRLKATAGRCHFNERLIDLSPSLMLENVQEFKQFTIPHELAHLVAWDVYKDTTHGPYWKRVMTTYGIPAVRCHEMTSNALETMRETRQTNKLVREMSILHVGDRATFVHRNRQKVETDIVGIIVMVNKKSYSMVSDSGAKWRIPKENNCNLRRI